MNFYYLTIFLFNLLFITTDLCILFSGKVGVSSIVSLLLLARLPVNHFGVFFIWLPLGFINHFLLAYYGTGRGRWDWVGNNACRKYGSIGTAAA